MLGQITRECGGRRQRFHARDNDEVGVRESLLPDDLNVVSKCLTTFGEVLVTHAERGEHDVNVWDDGLEYLGRVEGTRIGEVPLGLPLLPGPVVDADTAGLI